MNQLSDDLSYMEVSESKWVNPVLKNIGLTHLGSEASIYTMKITMLNYDTVR